MPATNSYTLNTSLVMALGMLALAAQIWGSFLLNEGNHNAFLNINSDYLPSSMT